MILITDKYQTKQLNHSFLILLKFIYMFKLKIYWKLEICQQKLFVSNLFNDI